GAAPEIDEVHLAGVVENDAVLEHGLDRRTGFEFRAVQDRVHVAERFHADLETEGDFQRAFARTRAFQLHFVRILVYPDENLRERDVLLRVEIRRELLVGQELVANENSLAGINSAKTSTRQRPAADRH